MVSANPEKIITSPIPKVNLKCATVFSIKLSTSTSFLWDVALCDTNKQKKLFDKMQQLDKTNELW